MKITFGGGLNEWETPTLSEAFRGSVNFELSKDSYSLTPRPPVDLRGTATNTADVRGFLQLIKRDDTETTLVQAGGAVYSWDGGSTFTSVGTCTTSSRLRGEFWPLNDYLVVTDIEKSTVVKKWDGSTFSTLTTGLGTDLYAAYAIVHLGRMWLFNVKTSTDTPHLMVASAFENPTSYDTTNRAVTGTFTSGLEAFYMLTPDLRSINGVCKTLSGDLIISTNEGSLFKLSGTGPTSFKWDNFYPGSQAIGDESIASMGNDVAYMRKGGNIESLVATQNYGDVASDDLSRWIPDTVKNLTSCITCYDQVRQKVFFFVENKILVLFKDILYSGALVSDRGDRAKVSPWSVYTTTLDDNFNTSAVKFMRVPGSTEYTVYFGGSAGQIYDMNGTGEGDGGAEDVAVVRGVRLIDETEGINQGHIFRGSVRYRRLNQVSLGIDLDWTDSYASASANVILKGASTPATDNYYGGLTYYGGSFYYSQDFEFTDKISSQNFSAVGRGRGVFITLSTSAKRDYQLDNLEIM